MRNKRAFTLTELLVVVVVLGVLAGVAAPKFMRVLETRKTTEAEEMMAAIRTEQEKRCIFGNEYVKSASELAKLPVVAKAGKSKTYSYNLLDQGIAAKKGTDYTLKMWYKTGQLCCEGSKCSDLNKNYPACGAAPADECTNYNGTGDCIGAGCEPDPGPSCEGSDTETASCGCNGTGTKQRTRTCNNGEWSSWSSWSGCTAAECPECDNSHKNGDKEIRSCDCGTESATWSCGASTNYAWVLGAYSGCTPKPADETTVCDDDENHNKTRSYNCVSGTWTAGAWDDSACEDDSNGYTNCSEWASKEHGGYTGGFAYCESKGKIFRPDTKLKDGDNPDTVCCQTCESQGMFWYAKENRCASVSKESTGSALRYIYAYSGNMDGPIYYGTYTTTDLGGGYGGYGGYGYGSSSSGSCTDFTIKGDSVPGIPVCYNSFCTTSSDIGKKCYVDAWTTVIQRDSVGIGGVSIPEGESCSFTVAAHGVNNTCSGTYHCWVQPGTSGQAIPDTFCSKKGTDWFYRGDTAPYYCGCEANMSCSQADTGSTYTTSNTVPVYYTRGLMKATAYECRVR